MSEEKKILDEQEEGVWKHDQQLSFKKLVPHLEVLKEALQKQINHEKAKLSQMVSARDSIRRR